MNVGIGIDREDSNGDHLVEFRHGALCHMFALVLILGILRRITEQLLLLAQVLLQPVQRKLSPLKVSHNLACLDMLASPGTFTIGGVGVKGRVSSSNLSRGFLRMLGSGHDRRKWGGGGAEAREVVGRVQNFLGKGRNKDKFLGTVSEFNKKMRTVKKPENDAFCKLGRGGPFCK